MTIGLLTAILDRIPKDARLMGLDVGQKTIGLALSDPGHSVATPLRTIQRTKFSKDMETLAAIVKDYEVKGFVIGLPLNEDGTEGRRCQSIRDFAAEMRNYPQVIGDNPWIALWDERFSTAAVEDFVDNSVDMNRRKAKASGLIDKLAAQHILQGALELITNCHLEGKA